MTTGEKIKQLRIALGMSQEELGKIVGVKKAAIYKYENGLVVNLKRSTIEKLASALGTTPMYLLNLEEKPTADDSDGLSKEEIELLKSLFLAGNNWHLIYKNCLILFFYAILFISLALKVTKKSLE